MQTAIDDTPSAACRWSSRLALFALTLAIVIVPLHRFLGLPTPTAFILAATVYVLAALSLLTALIGALDIWRYGAPGTARIALGGIISLSILLAPGLLVAIAREHPELNDIATDTADPPPFTALAASRAGWANPAAYPGGTTAKQQAEAYPDMVPLAVNRPVDETYELAVEALKRLHYTVVTERPPSENNSEGYAEAIDRTLILGFADDIAIRARANGENAILDVRSASRYGRSDLGRNAERIREILREMVARLEATVPSAEEIAAANAAKEAAAKAKLKSQKNADRVKPAPRKPRADARRASRREREQTEPPP